MDLQKALVRGVLMQVMSLWQMIGSCKKAAAKGPVQTRLMHWQEAA